MLEEDEEYKSYYIGGKVAAKKESPMATEFFGNKREMV